MSEALVAVAVVGIMSAVALPSLDRARVRAELSSATARFARTVGAARQAAIMRGKPAYFRHDNGAIWVTVDTLGTGVDSIVIVPMFRLDSAYGLAVNEPKGVTSIEFDPRGVATQSSKKTFRFQHRSGTLDSLCVSKLGNTIQTVCP